MVFTLKQDPGGSDLAAMESLHEITQLHDEFSLMQ